MDAWLNGQWKRDEFMQAYKLFITGKGFKWCQFFPSVDNKTTLFAVESWESHENQKEFMQWLEPVDIWKLFWLLQGQPEMWWVTVWPEVL